MPAATELTQTQAFSLLVAYCLLYVLPLYLFASTRPSPSRTRDHPENIRARIRALSWSTALCSLITLAFLTWTEREKSPPVWLPDCRAALFMMGWWPPRLGDAVKVLALTAILFAGPLYEYFIIEGGFKYWKGLKPIKDTWRYWTMWRNFVAGPITEECLFRSAAVPLLVVTGTSLTKIICLSPFVFGLAHLHHFYEFRLTNPQVPLAAAAGRSLVQLGYTTLFGALETFIFLRTGSLLGVTLVHAFCNTMGLPRVWGSVEPWWLSDAELGQPTKTFMWTLGYYTLLFGGAVTWWKALYPLTQSDAALITF